MPYGLLSTGYAPKPFAVCRAEIGAAIQAKRGTSVDVSDGSLEGQLAAIFAERESLIWDLGQMIVAAYDPDSATDTFQDAICALTGTFRAAPKSSSSPVTCSGTPSTVIASGSQVKTASTGAVFQSTAAATIAALAVWAGTTAYTVGQRVTNAGRAYQCVTAGTSAGSGGPTTTATSIPDGAGALTWRYLGDGTGAVDVTMLSLVQDAIVAVSGDLSVINTPIGGWQSAVNLLDATLGAVAQTNESLRVTREAELAQSGNATADAIRAQLLEVGGVTSCTVFVNTSDVTDGNGQPPHSIQALVQGGADTAIAAVLLANQTAGQTFGTSSAIAVDSQGISHTMSFTRPSTVNIYVDITLTYNPAAQTSGGYPAGGDALVQAVITAFGNTLGGGRDVVASALSAAVFPVFINNLLALGVQGVLDVTSVKIGLAPSPGSSTTLVMTPFQLAAFDTSRVTVHSSAGSL